MISIKIKNPIYPLERIYYVKYDKDSFYLMIG